MRSVWIGLCGAVACVALGCAWLKPADPVRPAWTNEPELAAPSGRFIAAVGFVEPPGEEETLIVRAEHAARAELGRAVASYVREVLTELLQEPPARLDPGSGAGQELLATVGAETSTSVLRQSFRHDTWRESRSGAIYVLYRLPVSVVNDRLLHALRYALEQSNPLAPTTPDEVDARLTAVLNERMKAAVAQADPPVDPPKETPKETPKEAPKETPRETPKETPKPKETTPRWLTLGRHEDYPAQEFLTVTGVGDSRDAAAANAREELAARLAGRMAGRRVALMAAEASAGIGKNLNALEPEALTMGSAELTGDEVAETWYDAVTDTHYALGVMARRSAGQTWRKRATDLFSDARESLAAGKNHHEAGNYIAALDLYMRASGVLAAALRWQMAAIVVDSSAAETTAALDADGLLPSAQAALRSLVGEITIRKVSGDDQWVAEGSALADPLVVEVVAGRDATPLTGVGLRFSFEIGSGQLDASVRSGARGRASCGVHVVKRALDGSGAVACGLDVKDLASAAAAAGVTLPEARFTFVTRTVRNTHLAVFVEELDTAGKPVPSSTAGADVAMALGAAGFRMIDAALVRERVARSKLTGASTDEDVAQAFAGVGNGLRGKAFVLVVVGKVTPSIVRTTATSKGDLHFARTAVTLRVVDPAPTGSRTALTAAGEGRDAFLDDAGEAVRRSRVKGVTVGVSRLVLALNKRFGTP